MEDWKYQISFELPDELPDSVLSNIYDIVDTAIATEQEIVAKLAGRLAETEEANNNLRLNHKRNAQLLVQATDRKAVVEITLAACLELLGRVAAHIAANDARSLELVRSEIDEFIRVETAIRNQPGEDGMK